MACSPSPSCWSLARGAQPAQPLWSTPTRPQVFNLQALRSPKFCCHCPLHSCWTQVGPSRLLDPLVGLAHLHWDLGEKALAGQGRLPSSPLQDRPFPPACPSLCPHLTHCSGASLSPPPSPVPPAHLGRWAQGISPSHCRPGGSSVHPALTVPTLVLPGRSPRACRVLQRPSPCSGAGSGLLHRRPWAAAFSSPSLPSCAGSTHASRIHRSATPGPRTLLLWGMDLAFVPRLALNL